VPDHDAVRPRHRQHRACLNRALARAARRARGRGRFLGVEERSYPRDLATFARYHAALPKLSEPVEPEPLSWSELEDFIEGNRSRFGVRWLAGAAAGSPDGEVSGVADTEDAASASGRAADAQVRAGSR
jgi:hypothetical protein